MNYYGLSFDKQHNNPMYKSLDDTLNEIVEELNNKVKFFNKVSADIVSKNLDKEIMNVITE